MFNVLRYRIHQGRQYIPDMRAQGISIPYRGFPVLDQSLCSESCSACINACPTGAIARDPLRIDLGACTFCGDCAAACASKAVRFSVFHRTAADRREALTVYSGCDEKEYEKTAVVSRKEIASIFGRSFKLREVSAGGCNGCELELNACSNVNFDMGRFGIEFVASPRHATASHLWPGDEEHGTGLTTRTRRPGPKLVIASGTCAISGGIFRTSRHRALVLREPQGGFSSRLPAHPSQSSTAYSACSRGSRQTLLDPEG
jgi:Ni,Fe-hydrogenase III small subunit/NAD-dependent dihydropyrimidine dehydrogenase PreA subunit